MNKILSTVMILFIHFGASHLVVLNTYFRLWAWVLLLAVFRGSYSAGIEPRPPAMCALAC